MRASGEQPARLALYWGLPQSRLLALSRPGQLLSGFSHHHRPHDPAQRRLCTPRRAAGDEALRYLAGRIDRVTSREDTQLINWSWESMQSSGFAGTILSDLEAGGVAITTSSAASCPSRPWRRSLLPAAWCNSTARCGPRATPMAGSARAAEHSHHRQTHRDIVAGGVGIGADLMGLGHQGLASARVSSGSESPARHRGRSRPPYAGRC